jgi:hypothetical protein
MKLIKSPHPEKKWRAIFSDGTHTDFGDATAQDFTQHGNKDRRDAYRSRHRKDLDTNDPTRAGWLSFYLLWGPSASLEQNLSAYRRRFPKL